MASSGTAAAIRNLKGPSVPIVGKGPAVPKNSAQFNSSSKPLASVVAGATSPSQSQSYGKGGNSYAAKRRSSGGQGQSPGASRYSPSGQPSTFLKGRVKCEKCGKDYSKSLGRCPTCQGGFEHQISADSSNVSRGNSPQNNLLQK